MADRRERAGGGFGPDLIQRLIPHRRPFLMVDRVAGFRLEPEAELEASRMISANDPIFDGHFPGWSLWPGVLTIEGLGQSCMLLAVLKRAFEAALAEGLGEGQVRGALRSIDAGDHLRPGHRSGDGARLIEALGEPMTRIGMASDVDVKLLRPVFAGERLDFTVLLTHDAGKVMRFAVEAQVARRPVARGTLGAAFDASTAARLGRSR